VHLIADSLSSVVVILGSVMIRIFKIDWIDPLITVLISLYIIRSGFVILKQSVNILMQSAPDHLDLQQIKHRVEQEQEVLNIHHLHAWMLTDSEVHMEAHVELKNDLKLSEVTQIQEKIEKSLRKEFGIVHLTLQFEFGPNHSPSLIHKKT
jgi:cobalt-zinc-cadmium efflux system protein